MSIVFSIFLNAFLIVVMVVFLTSLAALVVSTTEPLERAVRAASAFVAALVVVGSQAGGLSYANFIVKSLEHNRTVGFSFLAAGLPAIAGVGIGWYFVHLMKKSDDLTIRVLTFIGMLAVASFASIYAVGLSKHGANLGKAAIPNVSFAVASLLYVILKIDTKSSSKSKSRSSGNFFSKLVGRFNQSESRTPTVERDRLG
jgi:hypothetical protein